MANTSSAKKALRVSARRKVVNSKNTLSFRVAKKEVLKAVESGKTAKAKKLLVDAYSKLDIAAKKGTLHKNAASRYKSRLAIQVNKIAKQ
jgi:small subunit ribosomal protein S20